MTTETSTYLTLDEIKRANRKAGGHWFSPDAMRFFDTDLTESDVIYGGAWFVHSNTFHPTEGEPITFWKVAHAHPDGRIHDADSGLTADQRDDGHNGIGFATLDAARAYALGLEAGLDTGGGAHCSYPV